MPKKLDCDKLQPKKKSELEKASCEFLWNTLDCFSGGYDTIIDGTKHHAGYVPYSPFSPQSDTPLGRTFSDLFEVIDKRKCVHPIMVDKAKKELKKKFPRHQFNFNQDVVKVPKNLSHDELNDLKKNIKEITQDFYKLEYQPQTNRYYLKPNPNVE